MSKIIKYGGGFLASCVAFGIYAELTFSKHKPTPPPLAPASSEPQPTPPISTQPSKVASIAPDPLSAEPRLTPGKSRKELASLGFTCKQSKAKYLTCTLNKKELAKIGEIWGATPFAIESGTDLRHSPLSRVIHIYWADPNTGFDTDTACTAIETPDGPKLQCPESGNAPDSSGPSRKHLEASWTELYGQPTTRGLEQYWLTGSSAVHHGPPNTTTIELNN